eukprot:gnl/Trimastix_PCT/727.p1 GENE.gnl/Trimastix_PCT/727~~gnl/Trimastix_PCT/727.p1  ORF type:complete len:476 (-),score=203.75 gnl/Trimastix_PCT/727:41-1468(-)
MSFEETSRLFSLASPFEAPDSLPPLLVKGFDCEQIWEQIHVQNTSFLSTMLQKFSELNIVKKKKGIDDEFFSMAEMEKFVREAEEQDARRKGLAADDDESDEGDGIDIFSKLPDDEEDPEICYEDFYGPKARAALPEAEGEEEKEEEDEEEEEEEEEEEDLVFHREREEQATPPEGELSTFEQQQLRLGKKIGRIEEQLVTERPWQLGGEVTAPKRPKDSLLSTHLDFQHAGKLPPVVTDEATDDLVALIKMRVKEGLFDDVVRKRPSRGKVRAAPLEISMEKSKESLADIYARQYVEKAMGGPKEDPFAKEHAAATALFQRISRKIDALSNMYATSHAAFDDPVAPEANARSITAEEALPVTVSSATRLAPEEILSKPAADAKGETELTREDRRRARAQRKRTRRKGNQQREAEERVVDPTQPPSAAKIRKELEGIQKVPTKARAPSSRSSTAFFSKLQEADAQQGSKRKRKPK